MNSRSSSFSEKRKSFLADPISQFGISIIPKLLIFLLLLGIPIPAFSNSSESFSIFPATKFANAAQEIRSIIRNSQASNGVWAVSVRDERGQVIIDIDASTLMRTASNSKLFTSAGILKGLGPDFTFKTRIYGDGELIGDVWYGDIHIVGSGDPSIDGLFYDDDAMFVFNSLINQLKEYGITRIEGDVFGNEHLFDDVRYPRGWEWDDLSYYYAPEISALSFNRNCVDLTVRAVGQPGDRPQITWFPFNTNYVNFINEQLITPRNVRFNEFYARILGTNTIILRSTLPVGYLEKESLTITDPAHFFIDSFVKQASYRNLDWVGELISDGNLRPWHQYTLLAEHESKPLSELLKRVNRNSDNFYTEMLTKALAAYTYESQGSTEGGLTLIEEQLRDLGIDVHMLNKRDASGMAGANLSTADTITDLLNRLQRSDYYDEWLDTLAKAGYNGTLENRFIDSPALGSLYGKTGFISGVRTLSGYLITRSGQTLSYSILTNNFTSRVAAVDTTHEHIINTLYNSF